MLQGWGEENAHAITQPDHGGPRGRFAPRPQRPQAHLQANAPAGQGWAEQAGGGVRTCGTQECRS
jgi:hypothetical protein